MHAKFMKFGTHSPNDISDVLTKWYNQILLLLAVVPFFTSAMFEF
jgi:hypothetical protein